MLGKPGTTLETQGFTSQHRTKAKKRSFRIRKKKKPPETMASYSFVSALVDLLVIPLEILDCETERKINNVTYETSAKTNRLQ